MAIQENLLPAELIGRAVNHLRANWISDASLRERVPQGNFKIYLMEQLSLDRDAVDRLLELANEDTNGMSVALEALKNAESNKKGTKRVSAV